MLRIRTIRYGIVTFIVLLGAGLFLWKQKSSAPLVLSKGEPRKMSLATPTPIEAAEVAAPILPKAAAKLSPKDQRKMVVLMEILGSKNDNDPRMDTDLSNLSPEVKLAMEALYRETPGEKRNERGTIVFLIGREIKDKADIDFLKNVLLEKPCLSLADCSKPGPQPTGEDLHLQGLSETTANYPQLMAIREMTEQYRMNKGGGDTADESLAPKIIEGLREGARSPNPKIAADAEHAIHDLAGNKY